MSDTKTAESLIYEVAAIIWNIPAGEALQQPQYDAINDCIDPVLSEIENIVYVGDRDEIPQKFFFTIADLVAKRARAKASGVPVPKAEIEDAESRLRYLAAEPRTRTKLKIDAAVLPYRYGFPVRQ